ncbi:MAG TPA: hypothetical protein VJ717_12335 [Gemmatimonadaceae bacterium]|nr:hypothetical protein [Gemmatimonadaceae bacterium]
MAEHSASLEHRLVVERTARVHTLGALQAPDAWVVLHGYGQLAGRFISQFSTVAGPHRTVIAPEALNRFYIDAPRPGGPSADERRVGTTWMTREDRDADIRDYIAYLDRVAETLASEAQRLTVIGFSQGVATACRWVALGKTSIHRLIVWAGPVPPDLDFARLAQRLGSTPIEIVLGDRDEYALARASEDELRPLRESGIQYRLVRFDGGHAIDPGVLERLASA